MGERVDARNLGKPGRNTSTRRAVHLRNVSGSRRGEIYFKNGRPACYWSCFDLGLDKGQLFISNEPGDCAHGRYKSSQQGFLSFVSLTWIRLPLQWLSLQKRRVNGKIPRGGQHGEERRQRWPLGWLWKNSAQTQAGLDCHLPPRHEKERRVRKQQHHLQAIHMVNLVVRVHRLRAAHLENQWSLRRNKRGSSPRTKVTRQRQNEKGLQEKSQGRLRWWACAKKEKKGSPVIGSNFVGNTKK